MINFIYGVIIGAIFMYFFILWLHKKYDEEQYLDHEYKVLYEDWLDIAEERKKNQ